MNRLSDVLDTPEIRRRTQRVLALKEQARQAEAGLASLLADLGDELIATKAALDKTSDKTAWMRWLSGNVKFTVFTADNYMRIARLRKKIVNRFTIFSRLPLGALYEIAALPERLLHRLVIDPRLPSPKTGELTPLGDMDERDLKKALQTFKGRRLPRRPKGPASGTREDLARATMASLRDVMSAMLTVRQGSGKLTPDTKRAMLDEIDQARVIALHWPASAPDAGRFSTTASLAGSRFPSDGRKERLRSDPGGSRAGTAAGRRGSLQLKAL